MFPLLSQNGALASHGDVLGPHGFQSLLGFAQKGWMSYKFILSLRDHCGVTPCLTQDELVDDLCSSTGISAVLLALLSAVLCLEPGGHSQMPPPVPFLSQCYNLFGLLSFLRSLSHAGCNRRGISLIRGLSWHLAPFMVNLSNNGCFQQWVGMNVCRCRKCCQTSPASRSWW